MGQYHKLYNLDRKEYVHGHQIDNGLKLMEQCGHLRSTATALWLLIANSNARGGGDALPHPLIGKWAGNRVVVQGDYAKETDPAYIAAEERDYYTNISADVLDMLNKECA